MTIKQLAKYIIYYSPECIKRRIQSYSHKRLMAEGMERMKRCRISTEDIEHVLSQIDFSHDVMLHSSTINLGKIQGGVKGLTNALLNHIDTSRHTLVVSALPYFGSFADYLATDPVFDVRTAPIAMGAVNERIASMSGALRSIHPTHSVVAIGPDAELYTSSHHLDDTPFGIHSPYRKLIERRAHILSFGATINNMTFIHAVEDLLGEKYPVKVYGKRYLAKCIDYSGNELTVSTPVHDKLTAVRRDLSFLLPDGIVNGYIKKWDLGEGYVLDIDAYALAKRYIELLRQGKSIYGRCKKLDAPEINI